MTGLAQVLSSKRAAMHAAPDAGPPVPRRRWLGLFGAAIVAVPLLGCTSVSDPVSKPEDRLKQVLNPLGAKAEEDAFKAKVQKDPFPSAAKSGVGAAPQSS